MNTLLWKELRENCHWALLFLVGMSFAQAYVLLSLPLQGDQTQGLSLENPTFLTVTSFGYAGLGLVLGLVQFLPEMGRDRWALVLHRPVPRSANLRGKILAGLFLYFSAAVPPMLMSIGYVSHPGNLAVPFVPELTLPAIVDLCLGSIYYLAGVTLALARGSVWFRALPVLAAIYLGVHTFWGGISYSGYFYVAIERYVMMLIALWACAWGFFVNPLRFSGRPWLAQLGTLAIAYYGFQGTGELFTRFWDIVTPSNRPGWSDRCVLDTGYPLREIYDPSGTLIELRNYDDQPNPFPEITINNFYNRRIFFSFTSDNVGNSHNYHPEEHRVGYRDNDGCIAFKSEVILEPGHPEGWYEVRKLKSYIGYDQLTRLPVARIDATGLIPPEATPQPISSEWTSMFSTHYFISWNAQGKVHVVDLLRHTQSTVQIPEVPVHKMVSFSEDGRTRYIVGTDTKLLVFDEQFRLLTTLPYDPERDLDRWGRIKVVPSMLRDEYHIAYEPSSWLPSGIRNSMPTYYEVVDSRGTVLHRYEMPHFQDPPWPRSWKDFLSHRLQSPAFYLGTIAYKGMGSLFGDQRLAGSLKNQFGANLSVTETLLFWMAGTSLLFSGLTLIWAFRNQFEPRRAWSWAIFVFCFNISGFVAFAMSVDWPRNKRCPTCLHRRPLELNLCPRCKSPWPSPVLDGREILEKTPTLPSLP